MARLTLAAALLAPAAAQIGTYTDLAGYSTASDVAPHALIDLDMTEFETAVGTYATATTWITDATFIYENGGGGLCSAADVTAGTATGSTTTPWCTDTAQALGNSQKSTSVRTLKGFATKDYSGYTGNYAEEMPPLYTAYWTANGMSAAEAKEWAHTFITKDYSAIVQDSGSNQLMKKGANYQAVWMYVLHELEDAIGDCYAGDILANDNTPTGGAPHAWDEGWAFYAGSTVGATAADAVTNDGTLIWELAEKRGADFGTTHSTGPATANVNALALAIQGRDLIIAASCAAAEPVVQAWRAQQTVPLVQGTLKYAFKADPANTAGDCTADAANTGLTADPACAKSWAEGWAFAAAVLPQVHACDAAAATTIKTNLDIGGVPMAGGFAAVKTAIESTYACMGITCADVGAYSDSTACVDPVASSDAATAPALALGAAAAAAGAALLF
jgi:hypothetical protein